MRPRLGGVLGTLTVTLAMVGGTLALDVADPDPVAAHNQESCSTTYEWKVTGTTMTRQWQRIQPGRPWLRDSTDPLGVPVMVRVPKWSRVPVRSCTPVEHKHWYERVQEVTIKTGCAAVGASVTAAAGLGTAGTGTPAAILAGAAVGAACFQVFGN